MARRKIKIILAKIENTLQDSFDYVYNETLFRAGAFLVNLFTISVTLYGAMFGTMPVIPQWAWAGMFLFMLAIGFFSLDDLLHVGYDEDGNKLPDDEEDFEPEEDEEI